MSDKEAPANLDGNRHHAKQTLTTGSRWQSVAYCKQTKACLNKYNECPAGKSQRAKQTQTCQNKHLQSPDGKHRMLIQDVIK